MDGPHNNLIDEIFCLLTVAAYTVTLQLSFLLGIYCYSYFLSLQFIIEKVRE